MNVGRDSSVGTAARYGLDGPGFESRWEVRFPSPVQTGPGAHQAYYTTDTGTFPGVKQQGVALTIHPHLAQRLKNIQLYLFSPSGPSWLVLE